LTIKEETVVADLLSEPPVFSGNFAFFFDLDGTLADIKPHLTRFLYRRMFSSGSHALRK
jgi:trehalose-6-phosphatase